MISPGKNFLELQGTAIPYLDNEVTMLLNSSRVRLAVLYMPDKAIGPRNWSGEDKMIAPISPSF